MENVWEMFRGDEKSRDIIVPASVYEAGGKLLFAVKPEYDNDTNDTNAKIDKVLTDADIVETLSNGDKKYRLTLLHTDTKDIPVVEDTEYIAEFRYIRPTLRPITYSQFKLRLKPVVNLGGL